MKLQPHFMGRITAALFAAGLCVVMAPASFAQGKMPDKTADVQSVRLLAEDAGAAVEIIANQPITPQVTPLDNPRRLVIDLPYSNTSMRGKKIGSHIKEIKDLRVDQYTLRPPVARVVVDLSEAMTFDVDTDNGKILVHLRADQHTPDTVPALSKREEPVAVPVSTANSGGVMMDASRLATGSSVSAGAETAILHLERGGEVRVCANTTISVTASKSGGDLMLGMSTGSLEGHYAVGAAADSVVTPDFRLVLAGPGEFDYAMSVNSHGDTCIRTMPGNTAPVVVSELMGDGTYQVKPNEQVVFHGGQISTHDADVPMNCGCAAPKPDMLRASENPQTIADNKLPSSVKLAQPGDSAAAAAGSANNGAANPAPQPMTSPEAPVPSNGPNHDVHVQVEAPLVFTGHRPAETQASTPSPAPTQEAAALPANPAPGPTLPATVALPPAKQEPEHRGFFGSIGHFFKSLF
jgi:hypothetical protein